ncbi:MAG: amidophosphoribosyltransferase [Bacteroidetes bacterium]|nr:amidophosphoribosyltransferase [Bacteroidota bacterium]MBU1116371.1 amidophosphoribosyltransferase [Bacteroidota bacterium]MBU1800395.1 amidophosphoribosyltransferase [Bacteroidota bacterium]
MNKNIKFTVDKPTCNCGIFGIEGNDNDLPLTTYFGLHALQHRGQEASGIVKAFNIENGNTKFITHKGFGLVSDVYANSHVMLTEDINYKITIGHNRYSTFGATDSRSNIQPFVVDYRDGNLAIAHNGNITNAKYLRKKLEKEGAIFQTTSDSEVLLHLIARSKKENQIDQIREAVEEIEGAFSLIIMTDDKLIGVRDINGVRPLCLGKKGDSYIITSETCALDINCAQYIRDIEPGEILVIDKSPNKEKSLHSYKLIKQDDIKHCIFEYIYFSRPDSKIFGSSVDKIRRKLGKNLAQNHPVIDADGDKVIVMSVPDSSNTAAIGYQNQLEKDGILSKLEIGLIRSHYVGRTFILPAQKKREIGVRIKFNTVKGVIENKTIVLIDDSIVRGTTSKQLVNLIKEANPKSIHIRITSPPIYFPCYYGMDFPSKEELIANKFGSIEEIRLYLGVDSIEYMTENELLDSMIDHAPNDFCTACFTGKYPIPIKDLEENK